MSNYASVVALGIVPNRSDGMLSLHVGSEWIMLNPAEARRLKSDIECKLADIEIIQALNAPQGAAQPTLPPNAVIMFERGPKIDCGDGITKRLMSSDERSGKDRRVNFPTLWHGNYWCFHKGWTRDARKSQRRSASPGVK